MKNMKKLLALVLALAMSATLFTGCGSKQEPGNDTSNNPGTSQTEQTPATGQVDHMAYGIWNQSFDLKPFASSAGGRGQLLNLIWPRLVYLTSYGGTLEDAEMWLAKSITKVDDITWDVELYDYIYDNKGNHITAEDVKWSYEMAITVGEQTEVGGVLGSIEILDDYNLRFKLNSPGEGKAEIMLGFHRMTICSKAWYENASEEERTRDGATAAAYHIKEYIPGSKVVLEAVDNYWQKEELRGVSEQQNVKTIYCPVIVESAVRAISLENGEIDWTSVDVSALKQFYENGQSKPGWNARPLGGERARVMLLNMDENSGSPVATNQKLREAILTAIDVDSMRRAAGFDNDSSWVSSDIGTSLMAGYNPDWEKDGFFDYDPARAKELLAEAGYPNGLTLRFMYATSNNAGMAAVAQENLEAIGIHVEVMAFDQVLFNSNKYDSSAWDIEIDQKGGYSLIDDWYNLFNPGGYTNGGVNFCKDQTLYDLIDAVMQDSSQKNIDAVHYRLKELALGKCLYAEARCNVAQGGIIDMPFNNYNEPMMNAWTFASDFVSKASTD